MSSSQNMSKQVSLSPTPVAEQIAIQRQEIFWEDVEHPLKEDLVFRQWLAKYLQAGSLAGIGVGAIYGPASLYIKGRTFNSVTFQNGCKVIPRIAFYSAVAFCAAGYIVARNQMASSSPLEISEQAFAILHDEHQKKIDEGSRIWSLIGGGVGLMHGLMSVRNTVIGTATTATTTATTSTGLFHSPPVQTLIAGMRGGIRGTAVGIGVGAVLGYANSKLINFLHRKVEQERVTPNMKIEAQVHK